MKQIQYDGPVYDMGNLRVNTPRNHIRIHQEEKENVEKLPGRLHRV
ncbi:hypothetical protein [Siccibacter turicensis]